MAPVHLNKFKIFLILFDDRTIAQIFHRQRIMNGSIFFTHCGGRAERLAFEKHLRHGRKLLFNKQTKITTSRSVDLVNAGQRVRYFGYKRAASQSGVSGGIADISHTAGYKGPTALVVPTLLTISTIADLDSGRLLLPSAHFDVMGIPIHQPEGATFRVPFVRKLKELSYAEMKRLTGNAMHAGVVGVCLMYVLSCVSRTVPHGIEPRSSHMPTDGDGSDMHVEEA